MHELPQALPVSQTLQHASRGTQVRLASTTIGISDTMGIVENATNFTIWPLSHDARPEKRRCFRGKFRKILVPVALSESW
jgi:hypothetical protein